MLADPHTCGRKGGVVARDDLVGVAAVEPDVEAARGGTRCADPRADQSEEEPVIVLDEETPVGFERGLEAEVLHVEVTTGHGVADPKVQVVQVHGAILPDPEAQSGSSGTTKPGSWPS